MREIILLHIRYCAKGKMEKRLLPNFNLDQSRESVNE